MQLSWLLIFVAAANSASIGDRIDRAYTSYIHTPINVSDAQAHGWRPVSGTCEPHLGIRFAMGGAATASSPLELFFTPVGQVTGAGVYAYGQMKDNLVAKGLWLASGQGRYYTSVTFRSSAGVCSQAHDDYPLGDRLTVNAGGVGLSVPITEATAIEQFYTRGACFAGMGRHYFLDLKDAPEQSWVAANLLPIVPMYNNGVINAFFFASPVRQQSLLPPSTNMWEPIALINSLMCKNWCSTNCTFADTSIWSTMHLYLRDHTTVTCPGGCSTACCP